MEIFNFMGKMFFFCIHGFEWRNLLQFWMNLSYVYCPHNYAFSEKCHKLQVKTKCLRPNVKLYIELHHMTFVTKCPVWAHFEMRIAFCVQKPYGLHTPCHTMPGHACIYPMRVCILHVESFSQLHSWILQSVHISIRIVYVACILDTQVRSLNECEFTVFTHAHASIIRVI